jgi:hypothetical protein
MHRGRTTVEHVISRRAQEAECSARCVMSLYMPRPVIPVDCFADFYQHVFAAIHGPNSNIRRRMPRSRRPVVRWNARRCFVSGFTNRHASLRPETHPGGYSPWRGHRRRYPCGAVCVFEIPTVLGPQVRQVPLISLPTAKRVVSF